jgi:hypothetical protein
MGAHAVAREAARGVGGIEDSDDPAHMTLVAAYRTLGVPVLLGDFLISDDNRRRVGLKKKVHHLQSNLAVGWTGDEIAAYSLLTYLHERHEQEPPTRRAVEQSLTSFPAADLGTFGVEVIGWIYDGQPHCFRWRSDWPHEVFYDDYFLAGSGERLIGRMIGDSTAQARVPDSVIRDVEAHAVKETLWDVSRLMADEVGAHQNQSAGFGHAYEVLALLGGEFHYIEHVVFVFAEIGFDGQDRCISATLHPVIYRSHHVRDYAVVQVSRLEAGHAEHDLHLIGPVYRVPRNEPDAILNEVMSRPDAISFDAKYSCLFASLVRNARTGTPEPIRPVTLVSASEDQDRAVMIEWEPALDNPWAGALTVGLPMGYIEAAYRAQVTGRI